jgi:hypothetical protein
VFAGVLTLALALAPAVLWAVAARMAARAACVAVADAGGVRVFDAEQGAEVRRFSWGG